jgi:hypothetical protein
LDDPTGPIQTEEARTMVQEVLHGRLNVGLAAAGGWSGPGARVEGPATSVDLVRVDLGRSQATEDLPLAARVTMAAQLTKVSSRSAVSSVGVLDGSWGGRHDEWEC